MCKGLMHDTVDTKVACEGKEMGELLEILHEEFDKSGAQISVCVCGVCIDHGSISCVVPQELSNLIFETGSVIRIWESLI